MTKLAEASRCSSANPEGTLVNSKKLCGSQSRKSGQRIASFDKASKKPIGTLVTTMARNGTDFGIRVSGLGDQWFAAPAETPKGLYFTGFTEDDAQALLRPISGASGPWLNPTPPDSPIGGLERRGGRVTETVRSTVSYGWGPRIRTSTY